MSFINKCFTIIRHSDKEMFNIRLEDSIVFDYFDEYNNLISSNTLNVNSNIDFSSCNFTLDKNDNIYAIYKDNALKLIKLYKNTNQISEQDILTYNFKKFNILFPYIHAIDNDIHILYYVFSNNATSTCALFHHFNHNGVWTENKIDFINHICLDNFTVTWSNDTPIVFYFNLVNGYEEIFFSKFNNNTFTWSKPVQITNSKKNKLYLSVLKDSMNFYHITFCESENNNYSIKYLNGYLSENKFDIDISHTIAEDEAYMYPSLLKDSNSLYLMWVNYQRLYSCKSSDLGNNWTEAEIDEHSVEEDFTRAKFFSNYIDDSPYNCTSVFTSYNEVGLLGF
ncbi:MAG: hypothetical protein ACRDA3_01725 [Peptostreptococcaceae bacterium]